MIKITVVMAVAVGLASAQIMEVQPKRQIVPANTAHGILRGSVSFPDPLHRCTNIALVVEKLALF